MPRCPFLKDDISTVNVLYHKRDDVGTSQPIPNSAALADMLLVRYGVRLNITLELNVGDESLYPLPENPCSDHRARKAEEYQSSNSN